MKRIVAVAVCAAAISALVSANTSNQNFYYKKGGHSDEYGMGMTYEQYPQLIKGQEAGQKLQLGERLYRKALTLDKSDSFESNKNQAVQLWEEAASYGNVDSMYEIGYAYYVGYKKDVDVPKANHFLEFAGKKEQQNALGLYLVSQVYDSKYRKITNDELMQFVDLSANKHANVYGMLAYLKLYQDGFLKSKDPNRVQNIKGVIKRRLANPQDRVEKTHIPTVISTLKISL